MGILMGVFWFGGNMLYGIGVNLVGELGAVCVGGRVLGFHVHFLSL